MFWTPQRSDDYLSVLNGLRVISMAYIIFGHVHEAFESLPVINTQSLPELLTSWYGILRGVIIFVMGAFYSVDTFFFLSAFLGAYLMIPKLQGEKIFTFVMIYVHRFIRLVPTLAVFLAFLITFLNFMGSGPLWYFTDLVVIQPCK